MGIKYRVPVLEQYVFQPPVLDKDLSTPPVSPVKGDRYIVGDSATDDWLGKEKNIAWYDGSAWKFDAPIKGMLTCANDETVYYMYNGSVWNLFIEELGLGDMLKSVYDADANGIVDKAETIDDGTGNSATAIDVKDAVTKKHTHVNKAILDAIDVAFTTVLKGQYDIAYASRATFDADLGMIIFDL
ncbi:MAG: DUF2793 domain-containing protein [Patescibacteria group bacterium]